MAACRWAIWSDLIRNNGYNENPLTRLNPADQITRTINQFIIASVEAYCPYDRGKIASITAYRTTPSGDPTYRVTAYGHDAVGVSGADTRLARRNVSRRGHRADKAGTGSGATTAGAARGPA